MTIEQSASERITEEVTWAGVAAGPGSRGSSRSR